MFSSAAHSAVHLVRRTVFATLSKHARFMSVSTVCSTKNFYSESVLLSEKPSKAAKAKKSNGKKFEQSQLYPDELEKLGNYNLLEEFDLLMDDDNKTQSMQKDLRSGTLESVARKSEAVDKMPSMQEVGRSVWPESVAKISEAVEEVKIPETEKIDLEENDFVEKLSDSDSESDNEDYFGGIRKRRANNSHVNLDGLNITRLSRRSRLLREKMEKANSNEDGMVINDDIGGIFELAKMDITPEALFVCTTEALKYYPGDLTQTALYTIPLEDMRYWASTVKNFRTAIIGLYKEESLRTKTSFSEPEMPVTIICNKFWHRIGFAQLINSAYMAPPKLFITSKDCLNPWHGSVVRNSIGVSTLLNHNFGLTWEEIRRKIGENDRVYVLDLSLTKHYDGDETESYWSALPSVYLYDHSFWDGENITLIVMGSTGKRVDEELYKFCLERKALRIDVGLTKRSLGHILFHMVYFEMRRQLLAAENGNLCRSGSKNRTAKSRVRIVSTLFKT